MPALKEKQQDFTSMLLECNHSRFIKGELSWQTQRNVPIHPALAFQAAKKYYSPHFEALKGDLGHLHVWASPMRRKSLVLVYLGSRSVKIRYEV
jgi:hypothetical protein